MKILKPLCIILGMTFSSIVLAEEKSEGMSPSEVVNQYKAALQKKESGKAFQLLAAFPGLSREYKEFLEEDLGRREKKFDPKQYDFVVISEKIVGDCAVVTINETKKRKRKTNDFDPYYCIKLDGEWRLLPEPGLLERGHCMDVYKLEGSVFTQFQELEKWFKQEKEKLEAETEKKKS